MSEHAEVDFEFIFESHQMSSWPRTVGGCNEIAQKHTEFLSFRGHQEHLHGGGLREWRSRGRKHSGMGLSNNMSYATPPQISEKPADTSMEEWTFQEKGSSKDSSLIECWSWSSVKYGTLIECWSQVPRLSKHCTVMK